MGQNSTKYSPGRRLKRVGLVKKPCGNTVTVDCDVEIEVKVFDGQLIADLSTIKHEREIHKHLDHTRYRYVLDAPEGTSMHRKCKYVLVKDCYLPDFYVKNYNCGYYMVTRETLLPSYREVEKEK